MPSSFLGQRTLCLVTGASQGIGRCFAIEFARRFAPGSCLVLLARSAQGLKQTEELVLQANPQVKVQIHSVDLSQPNAAEYAAILQHEDLKGEAFEMVMLVHNAGSLGRTDQLATDMNQPEEWNRYLSLNLYHVTALTAEFLQRFPSGHRCLLNITSLAAVKPFKSLGYYCVGKAAREMYFKVLAEENPDLDILSYSPGPVDTEMVSSAISTVQNDETRKMFETLKETKTILTVKQTTMKVIEVLESRKYKSGDRHDYYDPL